MSQTSGQSGMYSTKRFHTTADHDYLAVGDNYVDKIELVDDRYKNRQFQTNSTKTGQTQGYFSQYKHSADVYNDSNGYIESQPLATRKNGFGTSDAKKRDEFTLNIKSLQYKEALSHEIKYDKLKRTMGKTQQQMDGTNAELTDEAENKQPIDTNKHYQYGVPTTLYDIGRTAVTPACSKCSRDKFYCPHRAALHKDDKESARHVGSYKTTTSELGALIKDAPVAQPQVKSVGNHKSIAAFYDSTHLSASQRL